MIASMYIHYLGRLGFTERQKDMDAIARIAIPLIVYPAVVISMLAAGFARSFPVAGVIFISIVAALLWVPFWCTDRARRRRRHQMIQVVHKLRNIELHSDEAQPWVQKAFELFDEDNSGDISVSELKKFISMMYPHISSAKVGAVLIKLPSKDISKEVFDHVLEELRNEFMLHKRHHQWHGEHTVADTEEQAILLQSSSSMGEESSKSPPVGQGQTRSPWLMRLFSWSQRMVSSGRVAPNSPRTSFPPTIEILNRNPDPAPAEIHNLVDKLDSDLDRALPSVVKLTAAPVEVDTWSSEGSWASPPVAAQHEYYTAAELRPRGIPRAVGTGVGADEVEGCRIEETAKRMGEEAKVSPAGGDAEVTPAACGAARVQAPLVHVVAEFHV